MIVSSNSDPFSLEDEGMRIMVAKQGTTSAIQLTGECGLAQQQQLRVAIRKVLAARPGHVVLDLSGLSFIDSSGIDLVIELARRASRENVHLVINPGTPAVQRVFALCGLTTELPFVFNGAYGGEAQDAPP
ncbi:MAG: STAS domain-containing protein [Solirubrobacteraceae bacterium]